MNNPLIYTDPDGELIWLIVGAVVGVYLGGVIAEQGQLNPEQWAWDETTWKGIGIGLASGALLGGAVDLLIAGELELSLGASTPAGKASVDLLNSDIELYWTTSAGGGGSINLTKEEYNRSLTAGPGGSSGGYYNPYGAGSGEGNPVKIVGGMASFDMTLATPGGGITFEMGEINIEGQDYMFISVGPSFGVEASISLINVGVMVAQPGKISVPNDFAGKGASYTGNASVFSLNISSARNGERLEKYAIIKGGVGVGFGGSQSMTTTWVWKVPDLYKGTEFEGSPYGPVP